MRCIAALATTSWILEKEGLLPTENMEKVQIAKIILHVLLDIFILDLLLHNLVNGIRTKNIMLMNRMCYVLMPVITSTIKAFSLLKNKKRFLSILNDLNSNAFNKHSENLNSHVQFVDKILKMIVRYYAITIGIFAVVVSFLPIIINLRLMIPAPFDMGRFTVFYKIVHFFITVYLALTFTGIDLLYMSLMGLCTAELNILEHRLTNIYQDAIEICGSSKQLELHSVVEQIIKECVVLHKTINQFTEKLSAVFSFPIFVQYICGCLIICSTILQLTIMGESGTANTLGTIFFALISFFQIAAYHWLGNEIIFKSNKIIESCYLSNWYELNKQSKASLVLLMERSKRPLAIQLFKIVFISLESLGVIVRWSYSLFAVIKARYK